MTDNDNVTPSPVKRKMKPRGGNSPVIGDNGVNTKPGDNARYAGILLEISSWPRIDISNVDELEKRLAEYLEYCLENDIKVGNMVCYLALGITKDVASDWERGNTRGKSHSDFIKKVKSICAGNREFLMQDGKVNPVTGIFWQKNHDGFRDQQDIILTPNTGMNEALTEAEIQRRAQALEAGLADDDYSC